MTRLRRDLSIISEWIKPSSHILDLGCGDGALLSHLAQSRQVTGYGVEIDIDNVVACMQAGVNVIQSDLDETGLAQFDDGAFNYVVMTQTLQAINKPDLVLEEMVRVGNEAIVTFPNMGHWRVRLSLAMGRMPVTDHLPHSWFNTPNVHLCTLKDFEDLCEQLGIDILQREVGDDDNERQMGMRAFPNLMGKIAFYRIRKKA